MRLPGIHVIGEQATEVAHLGLLALLTESRADLFNSRVLQLPDAGPALQIRYQRRTVTA